MTDNLSWIQKIKRGIPLEPSDTYRKKTSIKTTTETINPSPIPSKPVERIKQPRREMEITVTTNHNDKWVYCNVRNYELKDGFLIINTNTDKDNWSHSYYIQSRWISQFFVKWINEY